MKFGLKGIIILCLLCAASANGQAGQEQKPQMAEEATEVLGASHPHQEACCPWNLASEKLAHRLNYKRPTLSNQRSVAMGCR